MGANSGGSKAAAIDRRGSASLQEAEMAARMRAVPSFYIVDESLGVRLACGDPPMRGRRRMPQALENAVRYLRAAEWQSDAGTFGLSESTLVRLFRLDGDEAPMLCVMVERLRTKDPLQPAIARFHITERESEVLRLLVRGVPTATIATELNIAETTAAVHVKNIALKTDCRNRSQIIARVLGLI